MALDAGTTSNRCILFDQKGQIVSLAQKEFTQRFPKPGWVEHDANEIWSTMLGVAVEAMQKAGASYEDIAAIGITNQRETTIVWDKKTGEPVYNAIVWQCRRTSEYCDSLMERGLVDRFREKTGLVIDAYFSATKLKWILDEVPGVRERAERGDLYFGTVETWLIWKMTKGKVHVTDYTNASRTMLFNIHTLKWDEDILKELNIPLCMLPEVRPSSCVYGETASTYFGGPIPIAGAAGDQQAALFGQTCYAPGEAKNNFNKAKTVYTGNPRSEEIATISPVNKCELGLTPSKKLVVIVMGSLGSATINQKELEIVPAFKDKKYEVLLVTGERYFADYKNIDVPSNVKVVPFLKNFINVLKKTDLIVSRAGASTIAEVTAIGLPSILVPSPYVTNNHQFKNAQELEQAGASLILEEKDFSKERLIPLIDEVLNDDEKYKKMVQCTKKLGVCDSATRVYNEIKKVVEGR